MSEPAPVPLNYLSTRGDAPQLGFAEVLLAGLASDGGLYVPQRWPKLRPLEELAGLSYPALAVELIWPYVAGSFTKDALAELVAEAYRGFERPEVVPLVELADNLWLLELFWGPTLAFKDMALQLVGRLFDAELSRRASQVTIVGATSGDTGSAAIQACRDKDTIDIFMLHPHGRTSELQRRQMTTVDSPTVYNIAIEGSFDDCQELVKALFGDAGLREQLQLSAVNSINWARVMAQIVYYVWAWLQVAERLPGADGAGPGAGGTATSSAAGLDRLAFAVPTGNFGNVYAGYCAHQMGLGAGGTRFIVGTNVNDSLNEFFETAVLQTGRVTHTLSPSMDIMIPSNLERLIFDLLGCDGAATTSFMKRLKTAGQSMLEPAEMAATEQLWTSWSCDDATTLETMGQTYRDTGQLVDPHTAVGLAAARARRREQEPTVVLATAHPAKFPEAVKQATGIDPELPAGLAELQALPEHYEVLPNDLAAVRRYILERARLG